ncbi:MAG: alanine--tRNA ligase [Xanthomonadales bacterium]|nr:alanine--tRNA ligase [Xanthomonadales bacterium]
MLTTSEIRKKFIDYFVSHKHAAVPSSSLVPVDDNTLLFVNAGMVQFKNMFLGAEKRDYNRAASSQRCVRAGGKHNDLDQVGYTARHHTFFEMLGNFSFGDYFKQDAIRFAWEFLTKELKLPQEKLMVTVFEDDDEAEKIWMEEIGLPKEKVVRIGAKDNFWQMGDTGPCGPCSEIFYDHGEHIAGGPPGSPDEDGDRFIEIWNLVFMQFDRQTDGSLVPLPKPCVDTGMGLERVTSILQGKHNNYDIDLFQHIIKYIAELLNVKDLSSPSLKVIADHIRTCAFLISDGVLPGNEGRGYVLRRIIRRAIRHGYKLGANETFFYKVVTPLVEVMGDAYPELKNSQKQIESALQKEELRFAETLETGMSLLTKAMESMKGDIISGDVAFKLYDTYGFPLDLTQDVARESGLTVDEDGFNHCMQEQKERSKSSGGFDQSNQLPSDLIASLQATEFSGYEKHKDSSTLLAIIQDGKQVESLSSGEEGVLILNHTPFYAESGGQIGDSGEIMTNFGNFEVYDTQKAAGQYFLHIGKISKGKLSQGDEVVAKIDQQKRGKIVLNHTATHLLHKVLRETLGTHVQQKGSIVSDDKLRFDFSHGEAISSKQLQQIEADVNAHIRANYQGQTKLMKYDEAVKYGAMALFGEKYGDEVRVLDFGGYSIELCGGTHAKNTGEIGLFKILSESSIAAGIRRIEAVTGIEAINYLQSNDEKLNNIIALTHSSQQNVTTKISDILDKNKTLEKKLQQLEVKLASTAAKDLWSEVEEENNYYFLFKVLQNFKVENLRSIVDDFKSKYSSGVVVLANHNEDKVQLICAVTSNLVQSIKAGDIIREISAQISGKGGGRPDFAQGGGASDLKNLQHVMQQSRSEVKNLLNI